jgi:hypothetical protein
MFRSISILCAIAFASTAIAEDFPITGNVTSKCTIYSDTPGVYGNPTPNKLSTAPGDGGVLPIIRFDVAIADSYVAKISTPNAFSTSPTLTDAVNWIGEVTVGTMSETTMSGYETAKILYENTTEYDLTVAGSTWFNVSSTVTYGFDKSFPGGEYKALVNAECIAK